MEKLGQLRARDEWDLIVVDTPPSRSALDFLDAPARLGRFLDGRMLRLLLAPARAGGRSVFSLVTASFGLFSEADGQDPRRPAAHRPVRLRRRAGLDVRRLPGAGRADLPGAAGAGDGVPAWWPRRSRTRSGRPTTSPGGWRPSGCRWPAWCSTGCTGAGDRRDRRRRARPRPQRLIRDEHPVAADVLRVHAALMRAGRARAARSPAGSPRPIPRCRWPSVAAQPVDVHDIDGLRDDRCGSRRRSQSAALTAPQPASRGPSVLDRGLEHPPPARHLRVPAQQRAAFPLGHAAPHPELDPVVERVGQALVPDRAAAADPLRHVLLGALHKQRVRIPVPARRHDSASRRSSPCVDVPPCSSRLSDSPTRASRRSPGDTRAARRHRDRSGTSCESSPRRTIMLRSRSDYATSSAKSAKPDTV